MILKTICIDIVNTTTVVVLFLYLVYDILIQLQDLGPPMSKKKTSKESSIVSRPLRSFKTGERGV